PAAALRFKPSADVAAAFGVQAGAAPSGRARAVGAAPATTLWVFDDGALRAVPVTTGISDGTTTELVTGAPESGTTVVTAIRLGASTSSAAATATTRSPLAMTPGPPPR
ncbi:MAG: hypothetical protein Q7V01_10705, partial [Vicinamibacterales bacterium]|nr:hypothetical protein [Vicinamibacterales bacterium]